ncbi:MAG: lactate racemase domain-containing protein [Betaproteobacteria bacterium]
MIGDSIEVNIAGGLDIALPRMVEVKQKFDAAHLGDIAGTVAKEFLRPEIRARVKPGQVVAVGCGSRGIANIATIVKCVIRELQALGAKPFIFPAMGSHGAATAEGQKKVLEGYAITEATTGVPLRASMDTVIVGTLADGTPVHMDRFAAEADGIVVINRIKPHTAFRGATESGITKMLSIGIGKIVGAATYHQQGMDTFPELLPRVRDVNLARRNVLFGVGIVENAHDQTAVIEVIAAERIGEREPVLQDMAKKLMPRLFFDEIDVLIIDEMGKNISGAGFDPNITGRNRRAVQWNFGPLTKKVVVLGLTPESHGNATGIGGADIITMRLFKAIDVPSTYANIITSMNLDGAAIPMVMNNDREAIQLAVKTVVRVKPQDCRIVRIRNTLELAHTQVSEPLLAEVRARPERFQIASPPAPFAFDAQGRLAALASAREASAIAAAGR